MMLQVEKTYRGSIYTSNLVIEKTVYFALKELTTEIKIQSVCATILENNNLHIEVEVEKNGSKPLTELNGLINSHIIKECNLALEIKPKNISVIYNKN